MVAGATFVAAAPFSKVLGANMNMFIKRNYREPFVVPDKV
jgi:hypothetical protein